MCYYKCDNMNQKVITRGRNDHFGSKFQVINDQEI